MDKNTQRFVDLINSKLTCLIGTKWKGFHTSTIIEGATEWLEQIGYKSVDKTNIYTEPFDAYITTYSRVILSYKGCGIAEIKFRVTKDANYKSIEVKPYTKDFFDVKDESIEDRLTFSDLQTIKIFEREQERFGQLVRLFKAVQKEIGENASLEETVDKIILMYTYKNKIIDIIKRGE